MCSNVTTIYVTLTTNSTSRYNTRVIIGSHVFLISQTQITGCGAQLAVCLAPGFFLCGQKLDIYDCKGLSATLLDSCLSNKLCLTSCHSCPSVNNILNGRITVLRRSFLTALHTEPRPVTVFLKLCYSW